VVLLVQDAVPTGRAWLSNLVAPLERDARIAATWSRQVPRADASPLTRAMAERWSGSASTTRLAAIDGLREFESMTPWERTDRCTLDNVCSCVRRTVFERHRFPRVSIGEDIEWARDVLLAGHRIAFVPDSVVRHSHERSASYELRRTLLIHHRLRVLFGLATVPGTRSLARAIASSLREHAAWVMADAGARLRPGAWWRALSLAVAWPLGQYLGARAADWGLQLRGFRGI
jgi:rhamnosyltransferase